MKAGTNPMRFQILGRCPHDDCKGSIWLDGTCSLCARSVGEPGAGPTPVRASVRESFSDWSAKCNMREHQDCGGKRLDSSAPAGSRIVPCMCRCHLEQVETKSRVVRGRPAYVQRPSV